jgi:hypothetical protein
MMKVLKAVFIATVGLVLISGCRNGFMRLPAEEYYDRVYGSWKATMVANHTGLQYEGRFLDAASSEEVIQLALLEEWSTDDDTAVEWIDLHILETYGLQP